MSNFAHNGDAFYPLHRPGQAVPASPNLPRIEEEILAYWKQDDTFRASVETVRPAAMETMSSFSMTARLSLTACPTMAT